MTDTEPGDYDDFIRSAAYDASLNEVGVYVVWWEANGTYPDRA